MPAEFWSEIVGLLTSFGLVGALVATVGFLAWTVSRTQPEPAILPWKPWRVPWSGFEIWVAFAILEYTIPAALMLLGTTELVAGAVAFPIQIALLVIACRALYPQWHPSRHGLSYARLLTLAAIAWCVLTPIVLGVNISVLAVFQVMNWQPDEHPIAQLAGRTLAQQLLFVLQACVAAPLVEELLFRGMLLPWCIGGRERHSGGPSPRPIARQEYRPWFLMGFVALFAAISGKTDAMIFAGMLTLGLVVLWVSVRRGKRHVRAIYATSALFAAVHSLVWPSPIPLFLLGLGLGWLAVRTRGVFAPALVHGLFNSVSVLFVLRGSTL